jgi:enoyl-CoA hydratase/carnithine racemase
MHHLTWSIDNDVAELVLFNPPQNRIDEQAVEELTAAVDAIEGGTVRAVLLRADGSDFSFGGAIDTWSSLTNRQLRALFDRFLAAFHRFERLPVPVIAVVQGLCYGGGLELVLRADVVYAGESSRFGHPEQSIGLTTLLGGVYRMAARVGWARAFEWSMTSEQVPPQTMAQAGVVNHVVPDADLLAAARSFAAKLANGPTRAYSVNKALLRAWVDGGISGADNVLFDLAMPLFETNDVQRGIASAVNALRAGKPRPALDFTGN